MQDALSALEDCSAITVACIDGFCIGAGIELALACDLVYSTQLSKFCIKETVFGFAADLGLFQRGASKLTRNGSLFREYGFTADWFNSGIASEMGLVGRIFENEQQMISHLLNLNLSSCNKSTIQDIKGFIKYSTNNGPMKGLEHAKLFNSGILMGNPLLSSQKSRL